MIIKMIIRMIKLILMIPISLIFMNNQIQTQTFHIQKIVTKKIYLLMTIISTIHKIEIKQILIVDKDISMVLWFLTRIQNKTNKTIHTFSIIHINNRIFMPNKHQILIFMIKIDLWNQIIIHRHNIQILTIYKKVVQINMKQLKIISIKRMIDKLQLKTKKIKIILIQIIRIIRISIKMLA